MTHTSRTLKALLVGAFFMAAAQARAAGDDLNIMQRNATDSSNVSRIVTSPPPGVDGFLVYDGATKRPILRLPAWGDIAGKPATFTPGAHTHLTVDISDSTATGRAVLQAADAAAARATIGAGTSSFPGTFGALAGLPTTLAGYGITDAATVSALAGKFNTPAGTIAQYVRGDGSLATLPAPGAGTMTSITAGTGLTGGTITGSGTIALASVGTAGTYNTVTTDAQGRVISGTPRIIANGVARALNTCFQISASRDAQVSYAVDITATLTLTTGPRGSAYLRYYTDAACTAGQQTVIGGTSGLPAVLGVAVGLQNLGTAFLSGTVPAGTWARLETVADAGAPGFSVRPGQEVLQ